MGITRDFAAEIEFQSDISKFGMLNYPKKESKVFIRICTRHRGQLNLEKKWFLKKVIKGFFKAKISFIIYFLT